MPLERASHRISPRNYRNILVHLKLPAIELLGFVENISDEGIGVMVPLDDNNETIEMNGEDEIDGVISRKHEAGERQFFGKVERSAKVQIGAEFFQGIGVSIAGGVDEALFDLVLR